jgi:NAD(P)-dependent dehydrogenase (short-subunit alcohol dehydrogenase family)
LDANSKEWSQLGLEIYSIQCDLSSAQSVASAFEMIKSKSPKLDFLANVAGVVRYGKIDELTEGDWDFMMDTNLKSMFFTCRASVPLMRANGGGSIINVSSIQAITSQQTVAPYSASKGGIVSFTRSIALDYAKDGIRANSVLPGSVETPMLRASGEQFSPDVALLPIGDRFTMNPTEAAQAAAWTKCKLTIPIHYKTFELLNGTYDEFAAACDRVGIPTKELAPGESLSL